MQVRLISELSRQTMYQSNIYIYIFELAGNCPLVVHSIIFTA